ncbi:MAG TPA: hypothetical protein VLE97_11525 [Gaiellaceae bacterium]|nr:hypothetical protein [Gaiellaceae bacterium]
MTAETTQALRRKMKSAGFTEDEDEQLVFSAPDNLSGKPASPRYVQWARNLARQLELDFPGVRTRVDVVDQWVTISVTLPEEKKSSKQLDREIAEVLSKPRKRQIGYGISAIDDDEWSWSVEELREGQTTWGTGSTVLADGVEYSKGEAVANIKKTLANLGVDLKDAVRLPF